MRHIVELCFFITCIFAQVKAQNEDFEGNVQLMFDGNNEFEGILQVYTQGKWNTVCYRLNGTVVTDVGAAAAACRQLKHTTFTEWGSADRLGYDKPADKQPTAITGIRCPEVKFPSTEGDIFLMRCDNSDQLISTDTCEELVGIQCSTVNSGDQPYNGQIRRIKESDGDRTELLQINFENEWLPVCTKYMSVASADSACRQIGYTGSSQAPIPSNDKKRSWKIDGLSACNDSYPCFTDCITVGYTPVQVEHCDENQYEVYCQFDKSLDGVFSAGNKYICTHPYGTTSQALILELIVATAVMGALLILIIVVVAVGISILVYKYRTRHRKGYNNLDNNNDNTRLSLDGQPAQTPTATEINTDTET